MTPRQEQMIKAIAENEYSQVNGKIPSTLDEIGQIWADEIIDTPEDKGVFTTLLKGGYVFHTGPKDPDAGCGLTEKGFQEYLKLN